MSTIAMEQLAAGICAHAETRRREGDGTYYAFVPCIAHVAFENGRSADDALSRLRAAVLANLPRVLVAWDILGPR